MKKYDKIILNKINGNISESYKKIKSLSKIELIDFIEYLNANYTEYPRFETIKLIRKALEH